MFKSRFGSVYLFFAVFVALSFVTRTILLVKSHSLLDLTPWLMVNIYGTGLFFDTVAMLYLAVPFVLYLMFIPERLYHSRFHKTAAYLFSFAILWLLVFTGAAEYFFFDEFGARFNFIAVDYLIYTHEVLGNIRESYNIPLVLAAVSALSLAIFFYVRKWLDVSTETRSGIRQNIRNGLIFLALPVFSFMFVDSSMEKVSSNNYANELAANGIYSFFDAFKNNRISYKTFYVVRGDKEAFSGLRAALKEDNNSFVSSNVFDISREIRNPGNEKRLNVVVIVEESLSAEFLGAFGNKKNLTPNLDRLAGESIFFTNLYATGTRTDRGLESITLSVPPTPGRSLIKRPGDENLFSWGSLMKEKGYETKFFYGGNGYFDNMDYFFSHNGFDDIIDRADFSRDEVVFENAWGASDEDLFNKCLKEFTKTYGKSKPFFALVMTTSNHRPYTYPEGRIDIPPHSGRKGAVKYADYALGKFISDAGKEPWFKDTVFVIVADHCASSAGKTALPVKKYEIPLLIYSPQNFSPVKTDKLSSQIDIAPTVLGLLNFSYRTKFFGKDILKMRPEQERAFISTYERLGYIKKEKLLILDVQKKEALFRFDRETGRQRLLPIEQDLLNEAICYYQGASYLQEHNLNRF